MRSLTLPLVGFFALGNFVPLWAADPLVAVMPGDTTFFVNLSSLTKLRGAKDHPLMKSLRSGEMGKVLEPMLEKLAGEADAQTEALLKEETGLTAEELMTKFPGGAAASVKLSFKKLMEDGGAGNPDVGLTLVADFAGDEELMAKMLNAFDKLEETSSDAKKKAEENTGDEDEDEDEDEADDRRPEANWPADYEETITEAGGAKIHEWTVKDPDKMSGDNMSWGVAHGKAMLSIGDSDLKEVAGRLATPSDPGSLAATAAWKTVPDADRDADVLMGFNLEYLLGEVQEGLRVQMEKGQLNTGGLPINPLQAWVGAGLDQFRMAYVSTTLEPEDASMHMGLTYQEKPALLKIYAAKGPGTPPEFVPADVQQISWGTMDWGAMFDNIKELATAVSPMAAGGMDLGMTELKKNIGVDLRADILGQMGDDLWSVSHTEPGSTEAPDGEKEQEEDDADEDEVPLGLSALALTQGQSQVMGIALRDAKAFNLSLTSMINTLAPGEALFEDRDFMGVKIHQVKGTPPNMSVAWLIHRDTLIFSIGKPELLEKVLGGMEKKPGNPLIAEPHVKAAFAKLPEGGVSSGYLNAGQMMDVILGTLKSVLEDQMEGEAAEIMKTLPDKLDLPWYVVTRIYLGDQAADVRLRLSAKP